MKMVCACAYLISEVRLWQKQDEIPHYDVRKRNLRFEKGEEKSEK